MFVAPSDKDLYLCEVLIITFDHTHKLIFLPVSLSRSLTAATREITAGQSTQAYSFGHGGWIRR